MWVWVWVFCGHHDEAIVGRMHLDMHDVLWLARAAWLRVRVKVRVRVGIRVRVGVEVRVRVGARVRVRATKPQHTRTPSPGVASSISPLATSPYISLYLRAKPQHARAAVPRSGLVGSRR